ncbi:MAG: transketolase C-terminal domain-containing protein [Clostridia bacterium]|nr:transketolase C-terminal domain-containing protein [Clostridia bacterium]
MIATRAAYGRALLDLGARNPNVVVLDADLSKSTMTFEFAKRFPERFIQMGIAEQDLMGTAAGIATTGKIAFASTFAIFATGRAFEQVRNGICYPGLNVKICATHAGLTVGEDGASHQSIEDIALMRAVPKMTVVVPSDAVQTAWAVNTAAATDGPFYIRLGRAPSPAIYQPDHEFHLGKAERLRDGRDVTLIACGYMTPRALAAADLLAGRGISARVIDMATIKPLDEAAVAEAAAETGAIVTVEEHSIIGGLGGAVCECVCNSVPVPVVRVGVRDMFGKSGKPEALLSHFGLTAEDIASAAQAAVTRSHR